MKKRVYSVATRKPISSRVALISDLHACEYRDALAAIGSMNPDFILAAGDMFEKMTDENFERNGKAFDFFRQAVNIATVYYTPGNHEIGCCGHFTSDSSRFSNHGLCLPKRYTDVLNELGVVILNNSFVDVGGFRIGGLASGLPFGNIPQTEWMNEFQKTEKFKILMSHHPEYYKNILYVTDTDLIVSGHAHGGQWRIFSQGIFAPGQGFFPKYTGGIHDNRFVISRGCSNPTKIPRLFNPKEVVLINVSSNDKI